MKVLDHLLKSIRSAAVYNPEIQVAPSCILWPDRERQWENVIARLQAEMPELLVLGDYNPEERTGPAIWLRCVIAGTIEDIDLTGNSPPIIYLPGVSRQDLRAVESCPESLKPLAELQYQGVIWSQVNSKDWTILAYLSSGQGGLNLDVARDTATKNALQLALHQILDEDTDLLTGKHLDADYFRKLVIGDPMRQVLEWLDRDDAFKAAYSEHEWQTFVEVCVSQLGFDPQKEGILSGAAKLATNEGAWQAVWERFCEAPGRYPNIPNQIRKCQLPDFDLFCETSIKGCWPQWNAIQENELNQALSALGSAHPAEARSIILELEEKHKERRALVWAEMGESVLCCALEHLAVVAKITTKGLASGSLADMEGRYIEQGWRADAGVMDALAYLEREEDFKAVATAINAIYPAWVDESARYMQDLVQQGSYPLKGTIDTVIPAMQDGDCFLFVDGLRFDAGEKLRQLLEQQGMDVTVTPRWSALPSVTGTAKPAVAPLNFNSERISEESQGYNFEILTQYHLHKVLEENGVRVIPKNETGDGSGISWCEFGNIDHEGHDRGWRLARHLKNILAEVESKIIALIQAGWQRVHVVTDHGWLLLPGGLPKITLPSALSETKWGRCAALKDGVQSDESVYPWFWNQNQYFALAEGINCYRSGLEYAHGGVSLQECLTLHLSVSFGESTPHNSSPLELTDIGWKGLRCTVAIDGDHQNLTMDVRTDAGDPHSSVVISKKPFKSNGTASVVVEDEDLEGHDAFIVFLDKSDAMVMQYKLTIGGQNL
jgi:hypothetical protein